MVNHLSLVNQKLGFARATLSLLQPSAVAGQSTLVTKAQCEAVLLHLYTAYHFYLRELADANGVRGAAVIKSLDALSDVLRGLGKQPAEVTELEALASEPASWLSRMLAAYAKIFQSPELVAPAASTSENFIELVDLMDEEEQSPPDSSTLNVWLQEFTSLALRHRETSAEY